MSVMKLPIAVLPALTVLCATLAAQSSPRFDVASIKSSAEQGTADAVGLRITGSQVRITSLSLRDYIAMAYSTRPAQVIVADWAAQERFDIAGNLPDGASRDQVPAMLQALLADRFRHAMATAPEQPVSDDSGTGCWLPSRPAVSAEAEC